ncbi:MAG: helix-turn-helix transcriptional regulator [Gemmatimonadaceae bacterium]
MSDGASNNDRGERVRNVDALVQLAARGEMLRADSPFYTDDRLIGWLDRELASPERAAQGWREDKAAAAAERLRVRTEAARLRVRPIDGAALRRAADVVGTVPQVIESAARARCAPVLDLAAAAGVGRELWDEPCEQWVELPRGTSDGQHVALRVSGDSMHPLLRHGDVILVRLGGRVEPNTVVVARRPESGGYVVKRVGRVGRRELTLTSLNEAFPPITVPRVAGAVLGTVVMRWAEGGAPAAG